MRTFFLLYLFLLFPVTGHALDVPQLRAHVNDGARLLSPGAEQELELRLDRFERQESTQIVILTVPTLAGENLEEFSIKVAEAWRIGRKQLDNGVILLIAKEERRVRIEVGRGLEGVLTDLVSGRIIRQEIAPRFKAGDMDGGVKAGVAAIMAAVKGEYKGKDRDLRHGGKSASPIYTLVLFLLVGCVFLGAMSKILGGVAGAAGLPFIANMVSPGISMTNLLLLGAAGFVVGLLLAFLFGSGRGGGYGGPFFGGGYGGGPFTGGGNGGFSGGGGDFGGGGASGDW